MHITLAPFYKSFRFIPQSILDDIWYEIKDNTTLLEEAKDVVLKDLNSKWKQGKYEIKRDYFKPYMNDKEKLVEVPTCRLPPDQWSALVRFWELIKAQLEAANIEPSRIDLFARSRAWKGKCPLNENTRHIIYQLNYAVSQVPEQEKTRDMKEKIFTDIMGSDGHGRVRCMGQGITPSQYRQSLTSNDALKKKIREEVIQEVRREMRYNIRDEMKEQLREEMREEMRIQMNLEMREEMREEREEMRKQMKFAMNEQFAQQMAQMRDNINKQVAENVVMYLGSGPMAPLLSNTYENIQVARGSTAYGADLSSSLTNEQRRENIDTHHP